MSMPLEDVAREAIELPRHQRLSLARLLIDLDDPGSDADVEAAWDVEIHGKCQSSLLTHLGRAGKGCPCRASCALNILGPCIT